VVKGEVSRAAAFKIGKLTRCRCGVKFLEIDEKARDEIIGFIFAESRERIR
jgi:c-di-GMP-binding flagellar brake protein YcgR